MSNEEIIQTWKNEELPAEKPGSLDPTGKWKLKKKGGKAPASPAGETELSDEDLDAVEGGLPAFINSLNVSCYEICENPDKE